MVNSINSPGSRPSTPVRNTPAAAPNDAAGQAQTPQASDVSGSPTASVGDQRRTPATAAGAEHLRRQLSAAAAGTAEAAAAHAPEAQAAGATADRVPLTAEQARDEYLAEFALYVNELIAAGQTGRRGSPAASADPVAATRASEAEPSEPSPGKPAEPSSAGPSAEPQMPPNRGKGDTPEPDAPTPPVLTVQRRLGDASSSTAIPLDNLPEWMREQLADFTAPVRGGDDKGAAKQGTPHGGLPSLSWRADGAAMSTSLAEQQALFADLSQSLSLLEPVALPHLNTTPLSLTARLDALPPEHREFVECVEDRLIESLTGGSSAGEASSVGSQVRPGELRAWAAANSQSPAALQRRNTARDFADELLGVSSAGCLPAMNNLGSRASGAMARAGTAVLNFLQRVGNSELASALGQISSSAGHVHVRNVAAVMLPTMMRHFVAYGVEAALEGLGVNDETKAAIALLVSLAPVAAQVAGAIRDRDLGTATATSQRSRAIMGGTTLAAAMLAAGSGTIAQSASNMVGVALYTALRDVVVQSRVRLHNPNTEGQEPTPGHWAAISAGYAVDQMLVSMGMTAWGPQAGASGRHESLHDMGVSYLHAAIRGLINHAGEVTEDLMYQGYPAVASLGNDRPTHALNLVAEDVGWQYAHVMNGALGGWAVRTGIISLTINSLALLERHVYENADGLSEASRGLINHAVVGIINGVLYHPFATASDGQPSAGDLEAARAARVTLQAASAAEAAADAEVDAAPDGVPSAGDGTELQAVVVHEPDAAHDPAGTLRNSTATGGERRPESATEQV